MMVPTTRVNTKNFLLATIPKLSPSYFVKFEFKPTQFQAGVTNIIHLTTGGDCCNDEDRIPGVWLQGVATNPR